MGELWHADSSRTRCSPVWRGLNRLLLYDLRSARVPGRACQATMLFFCGVLLGSLAGLVALAGKRVNASQRHSLISVTAEASFEKPYVDTSSCKCCQELGADNQEGAVVTAPSWKTLPAQHGSIKHSVQRGHCNWGELQGWWQPSHSAGGRWQVMDKTCALQNLIPAFFSADACATVQPSQRRTGILFLGDSVDSYMVSEVCNQMVNGSHMATHYNRNDLHGCQHACNGLDLGMWHIPGISLAGPYLEKLQGNMLNRTLLAYQKWEKHFSRKPDLVVLSSNFWTHFPDMFETDGDQKASPANSIHNWQDGGTNWPLDVTPEFVDSWVANFTLWVKYSRSLNPTAKHVYHTVGLPHWNYNNGRTNSKLLRHMGRVHAINSVGRHASSLLCLDTVDYEAMASGLPPSQYLKDGYHTNKWLQTEAFNVFLNYLVIHTGSVATAA